VTDKTRYCPTCNSTDLIVDEIVIQCKKCERILEVHPLGYLLADKAWVDS